MMNYSEFFTNKAQATAQSCLMVGNLLSKVSVVKAMVQPQYLLLSKFENIAKSQTVVNKKLFTGIQFEIGMQSDHKGRSFADKCKLIGEQLIDTGLRCADQYQIKLDKRDYRVTVAAFEESLATCAKFINDGGFHQESHIRDMDGSPYRALTRHDAEMRYCDLTEFAAQAVMALHAVQKLRNGTDFPLLDEAISQVEVSEDSRSYLNDIAYHDFFALSKGKQAIEIHINTETGSSQLVTKENPIKPSGTRLTVIKAPAQAKAA